MKLIGAYALAGPLAALVGLGFVGYGEHAVVTLTVASQRLQVENVPLAGLSTTQLEASASEQQTVTSTVVQVPASPAGGRVTFMCSPMTSCPNGYTVVAGTIVESTAGIQYRTLSAASFPSCAPSSPVAVSALSAGASGNAGAGTVVYGQFPAYIHVTNTSPIVGGVDAREVPVVQQSDVDTASGSLTAKISSELPARLQAHAGGLSYLMTGAPAFSVASDAHVGDSTPTFTVTVTGTIRALGYSAQAANALLRHALVLGAPAGYQLTPAPIKASYAVLSAGGISGSARGYVVPSVDRKGLAISLRGESPSQALSRIDRVVPGAAADIRISPIALPWLPMLSDHISVVVVINSPTPQAGP